LASLDLFREERTLDQLQPKIAHLSESLQSLRNLPWVGEIRQCGFIVGIDILLDPKLHFPFPWEQLTGAKICTAARNHGLLTRPVRDTLVLMPPFCITLQQLDHAVEALRKAILEVCAY